VSEQLPLQSLAAQLGGLNDSEQHFDQHPALVLHPRQNQRPPRPWQVSPLPALHLMPQTPQFWSVFVVIALPPQQRANASFAFHW
jgi:hypothetical protein